MQVQLLEQHCHLSDDVLGRTELQKKIALSFIWLINSDYCDLANFPLCFDSMHFESFCVWLGPTSKDNILKIGIPCFTRDQYRKTISDLLSKHVQQAVEFGPVLLTCLGGTRGVWFCVYFSKYVVSKEELTYSNSIIFKFLYLLHFFSSDIIKVNNCISRQFGTVCTILRISFVCVISCLHNLTFLKNVSSGAT